MDNGRNVCTDFGTSLKTSIDANDMDTQEHFFPGITTLGDILKEQGYSQTLLIGSKAELAGEKYIFQSMEIIFWMTMIMQ